MVTCGGSDEDQMAEIKERWSLCRVDHGPLLPHDVTSSEPSKLLKRNERPKFKS